jgi:hypothetical protein
LADPGTCSSSFEKYEIGNYPKMRYQLNCIKLISLSYLNCCFLSNLIATLDTINIQR